MQLQSSSFADGAAIPGEFAFAVPNPENHVALSRNRNPHLCWSGAPAATQSLVLICHDPDVPSRGDDVNKEGREIPDSLPRVDFFHWLLLDIPPGLREIAAGSHSDGIVPHGKAGPDAKNGLRHGINDYTGWFAGDAGMQGNYYGYDGPCPPWNDSIVHHYTFTLYALDIARLNVQGDRAVSEGIPSGGDLTGANVRSALAGHVLAQAQLTGTYTLNPRLRQALLGDPPGDHLVE